MNYFEVAILKSPLEPFTYRCEKDVNIGTLVEVPLAMNKGFLKGVVVKKVEKPDFKCKDIENINEEYYLNDVIQTAQFISKYYVCSLGEALSIYTPYKKTEKINTKLNITCDINLSKEQSESLDFLEKNHTALLFANTGSGKTEIYIKEIEKIIKEDKQAVLLLPEISLTPQIEKRLKKVFNEHIAIWHSKITKKTKEKIINELLSGKIKVIAGARSALFLPFENLSLIIVDEEHDDSYKSDQKPRLNVKDLSIYMGKRFGIKVILGSATPSLNSFFKIPYKRIKTTYFDTKRTISYDNSNLSVNDTVIEKIKNTIEKKQQVIVFLPTRANFKYQICKNCAKSVECPFCSVSLSLHKNKNALVCHYCNYTQSIPKNCPYCKIGEVESFRLGTAEVFDILSREFPDKKIAKFDKDSIKTQKQLKGVLKDFNDEKIDILIGTQMLSKGHDYHNVTLAVVLGIDSILNMTSYKVREKALSLLIQIAGRSGRKGFGEVLVQTKNQEFFNNYLSVNDYEDFLKEELNHRKDIYPPYVRFARVVFSDKNAFKAKEHMEKYVSFFMKNNGDIELVGFGECNVFKISNKYRYELLLRSKDTNKLLSYLHTIKSPLASIDMDSLY